MGKETRRYIEKADKFSKDQIGQLPCPLERTLLLELFHNRDTPFQLIKFEKKGQKKTYALAHNLLIRYEDEYTKKEKSGWTVVELYCDHDHEDETVCDLGCDSSLKEDLKNMFAEMQRVKYSWRALRKF